MNPKETSKTAPREYSVAYTAQGSQGMMTYWNCTTIIESPKVNYDIIADSIKKTYGHKSVVILSVFKNRK